MGQLLDCYPKLNEVLQEQEVFSKPLSKLKEVYETLDLGDFSEDVLKCIAAEGIKGILSNYKTIITDEIDRSGIKSTRMRAIMLHGYDDAAIELENAVNLLSEAVETRKQELAKDKILSVSLTMEGCGFEKRWGESKDPKNSYKRLEIGKNSWISTKCKRSWGFEYSVARYEPGKGDVYLYAKCPVIQSEPASLIVAYEPLPNTNTHYQVLVKSGPYSEVNFNF